MVAVLSLADPIPMRRKPKPPIPFPGPRPLPPAAYEQQLADAYVASAAPLRRYVASRLALYGLPDDRWNAAEDIVQDVFIAALRELRRGHTIDILRPWLYGVAKRLCDRRAWALGQHPYPLSLDAPLGEDGELTLADTLAAPDVVLPGGSTRVDRALEKLRECDARALIYREVLDWRYEAVAHALGAQVTMTEAMDWAERGRRHFAAHYAVGGLQVDRDRRGRVRLRVDLARMKGTRRCDD